MATTPLCRAWVRLSGEQAAKVEPGMFELLGEPNAPVVGSALALNVPASLSARELALDGAANIGWLDQSHPYGLLLYVPAQGTSGASRGLGPSRPLRSGSRQSVLGGDWAVV